MHLSPSRLPFSLSDSAPLKRSDKSKDLKVFPSKKIYRNPAALNRTDGLSRRWERRRKKDVWHQAQRSATHKGLLEVSVMSSHRGFFFLSSNFAIYKQQLPYKNVNESIQLTTGLRTKNPLRGEDNLAHLKTPQINRNDDEIWLSI